MEADRPAKRVVRDLWVEAVRARKAQTPNDMPFYITLPGAGADIQVLIDAGLIETTETGAIADSDNQRVIAVEQDSQHVLALKTRFRGLRVVNKKIEDLMQGTLPFSWPDMPVRKDFKATVVNLDFNQSLKRTNGNWPVLGLISKIAELHRVPDRIDWTLLLTLQGSVSLPLADQDVLAAFLGQLLTDFTGFADDCAATLLARALQDMLVHGKPSDPAVVPLSGLDDGTQAQILMAGVPALIAHELQGEGWRADTIHNLRYGGADGAAMMVTFIISLTQPGYATNTGLLKESLASIPARPLQVDPDGSLIACAALPT
jgi:hypothetical protein